MLHIVINPTAGNGRAARVGQQIIDTLRERNIPFEAKETEYVGHATELATAAKQADVDTVVAVGGDGTLLEVVRGLHGGNTALGIVPAGTGNDVVKMLGTPRRPMEALEFILSHPARALDAGRINDSLFLNVSGTGFDVVVLDNAQGAKRFVSGMLPYLWGVLRTLFTYKPVHLTIEWDDQARQEHEILLVAIANGRFIGGGMEVAPDAHPDDGLFDMVLIENMPRWKLPRYLPKLLNGTIAQVPNTVYTKCRRVYIAGEGMRVNIDGEVTPMASAEMEILPKALMAHW